jgi:hypothetical protein
MLIWVGGERVIDVNRDACRANRREAGVIWGICNFALRLVSVE